MWVDWIQLVQPPHRRRYVREWRCTSRWRCVTTRAKENSRSVAAHVAFERHILKPVFHLIGARVETTWVPGAFQLWAAMGQGESRASAPPWRPRARTSAPPASTRPPGSAAPNASELQYTQKNIHLKNFFLEVFLFSFFKFKVVCECHEGVPACEIMRMSEVCNCPAPPCSRRRARRAR
jgi:hypothetical protein